MKLKREMDNLLKRIRELNDELIIREATQSDALGFTSLINKRYARKGNKDYFLWRFFSCPTLSILYVITTKRNVIIGAYGVNIFTLSDGKKCGLTVDLIISDRYTKRGLFFLLEDKINNFAKNNNCIYLLSIPNTQGMLAHTKIERWQMLGTIPMLTLKPGVNQPIRNYRTISNLDQTTTAFEYNKPLLHWRFVENPEYKYLHIKSGKSRAYVKIFTNTREKLVLGDIVYYSSSSTVTEFVTLINKSVQKLQAMNAQKIITWCNKNSPLFSLFISLGFVPQNQQRYICVKPLLSNTVNPELIKWQILPADSEIF